MRISDWSSDVCSSDLHQVLAVSRRDQHALPPCESALTADIEEPLDLLVDATDDLHVTVLVDRAGHREILADRHLGEGGEQGVELGDGRAVRSEEHTSELQSLMRISYAVFCLTKKQ